jgi:hypothetical protein
MQADKKYGNRQKPAERLALRQNTPVTSKIRHLGRADQTRDESQVAQPARSKSQVFNPPTRATPFKRNKKNTQGGPFPTNRPSPTEVHHYCRSREPHLPPHPEITESWSSPE